MFLLGTATITGSFDRLGAIPTFLHSRSKLVRRLLEASESSSVTTTRTAPSLLRIACNSFGNRCRTDCSPDPPDPSVGRGSVSMSWFLKRRLRNPRTNVFVRRSSQSRMILALIPASRERWSPRLTAPRSRSLVHHLPVLAHHRPEKTTFLGHPPCSQWLQDGGRLRRSAPLTVRTLRWRAPATVGSPATTGSCQASSMNRDTRSLASRIRLYNTIRAR